MNENTSPTERLRAQLLEAMSAVSEDRTCCGWASDWARTLHAEGGIWEVLGHAAGWPTGNYDKWVWVPWEEAAAQYGHAAVSAVRPPATRQAVIDAVVPVLPEPADRAAVLREAADAAEQTFIHGVTPAASERDEIWDQAVRAVATMLRGLAAEPAAAGPDQTDETQTENEFTESVIYEVVGDWGVDSADSAEGARAAVAKWLRAYPKCGAHAQQRIYRDWPDGSEWYGPWTDLPAVGGAQQQTEARP